MQDCANIWSSSLSTASSDQPGASIKVFENFSTNYFCPSPSVISVEPNTTIWAVISGTNTSFPLFNNMTVAYSNVQAAFGSQVNVIHTIMYASMGIAFVFDIMQLFSAYKVRADQGWDIIHLHGASIHKRGNGFYYHWNPFKLSNYIN